MIDVLVKVVDRTIQLLEKREKKKRELFEDYIKPIFVDMEKIHTNYLEGFVNLMNDFNKDPMPPEHYRSRLLSKKVELESARVKVHSIAKHHAYGNLENLPPVMTHFVTLCLQYFRISSGEIRDYAGHYTDLISLIDGYSNNAEMVLDPLDQGTIERYTSLHMLGRYSMGTLGSDVDKITYLRVKRQNGEFTEEQAVCIMGEVTDEDTQGWEIVEKQEHPMLKNKGTLGQNLEITISYLRNTWNEITDCYAQCQAQLL
ncbi:MAG: hypothetical protein ACRBHB_19420 [Arenicella sp.]